MVLGLGGATSSSSTSQVCTEGITLYDVYKDWSDTHPQALPSAPDKSSGRPIGQIDRADGHLDPHIFIQIGFIHRRPIPHRYFRAYPSAMSPDWHASTCQRPKNWSSGRHCIPQKRGSLCVAPKRWHHYQYESLSEIIHLIAHHYETVYHKSIRAYMC